MYDQVVKCQRAGLCLSEHFLIPFWILHFIYVVCLYILVWLSFVDLFTFSCLYSLVDCIPVKWPWVTLESTASTQRSGSQVKDGISCSACLDASVKEVMFSSAFVHVVSRITQLTTRPIFTKFSGMEAHGPREKPLNFVGNSDHIMSRLALQLGGSTTKLCVGR